MEWRVAAIGLGSNEDNFLFVRYTNGVKQFEVTLGTNFLPDKASAGIMVRDSKAVTAPFLFVGISCSNVFTCTRTNANGQCTTTIIGPRPTNAPVILKFLQNETNFTASYSTPTWLGNKSGPFASKEPALIGFAAWSGNPTNQATVSFTHAPPSDGAKPGK
jgi:hypothetical protein